MDPSKDLALAELHSSLTSKHDAWWAALRAGEYVWAAYYANDLEAIVRRLANITHNYVKESYADPESALGRHRGARISAEEGD